MQCYEQFGWTAKDVYDLPAGEADLLSIYFEEVAAHQYKRNQEMKRSSGSSGSSKLDFTDISIGDEEDDE